MSDWASLAWVTLVLRALQVATPRQTLRHLKWEREAIREREGKVLAAEGAFRIHAATGMFAEFAVCGAPYDTLSGGLERVECRTCRRQVEKATAA